MTDEAGYRPTDDSALRWEDCHCTKCGQPDKKCECVALTPGTKPTISSNVMTVEDHLRARIENQRLEIERLRGLKPELPPRAPDGEGLPRYGLRWNGPHEPMAVPMDDGFWTPWHLAAKAHGNETPAFACKANRTADPPQDCDWPHCGCDPAATKVLEALQEEGWRPPARALRSPGDLSPEEFQEAWRKANELKASEPLPCEHLRSEWLGEKRYGSEPLFEMRKCLDCAKIFRVRKSVGK